MISHDRKQEIVAVFQQSFKRDNSADIEAIRIDELRDVIAMLGPSDLNAGYRIAVQNRIGELDQQEQRKHESKIRAWNLVVGIIAGLAIAGLVKLLFG